MPSTAANLPEICATMARWLTGAPPAAPGWSAESWDTLRRAARVHGIAPLLHEQLAATNWLDGSQRAWLAEQRTFNAQRVARMQAELAAILALFAGHNLPVMPLKGAILAATAYPDPGLRPMADLDLLVRPADFERAAALLAQLGYRPTVAHWKHTEFCRPDNLAVVSKEVEHPDNPRRVELHAHCRESFGGPTVEITQLMWRHAAPGELLGQPALLPEAGALWLHLLIHASYHFWQGRGRLVQLLDLRLLTPRVSDPARWLAAVDGRATFPALSLLQQTLPGSIAPELVAAQQKRVSPRFAAWANTLNLVNASYLNLNPPGLYVSRALRFADGRPADIARALRFALLPDLNELSLDHPRLAQSRVPWLAYALLPLDWLRRMGVGSRE
ncbi:MAG: nucleotidyltransferase family protein [Anaerolineae bacterium]